MGVLTTTNACVRISPNATVELVYRDKFCRDWDETLDCRLLFTGKHVGQLRSAYRHAVELFQEFSDSTKLRDRLLACEDIQAMYAIGETDGKVSITMREAVFRRSGPIDEIEFAIRISMAGRKFFHRVPLTRFAALGNLMPLLLGNRGEAQLKERLAQRLGPADAEWAVEVFDWLKSERCLESGNFPNQFPRPAAGDSPRITFMGHTSLLMRSGRSAILTDPIFLKGLGSRSAIFDLFRSRIDAVCLTHSHWDHCHFGTLLWIDKDTPILIPEVKRPSAFNPPMAEALRRLGFTDVREIDHWAPYRFGDVEVVPTPFYGEQDEPDAEIDHYTYVLKADGLTAYGGVDCYRDSHGDMRPVLERVRDLYHPNVAFLPISRMIYQLNWGGVNAFCRYLDHGLLDQSFQYTASADDAAEWSKLIGAKAVAPYATFIFSRWACAEQAEQFDTALRRTGIGNIYFPLRPLDSFSTEDLQASLRARVHRQALIASSRATAQLVGLRRRLGLAYRCILGHADHGQPAYSDRVTHG
jgi:L-ascorbate metabolism protein UlaG (beta-lactamase superfamily)